MPSRTRQEYIRELLSSDLRIDFLEACRVYARIDSDDELDAVTAEFPGLRDYDAKGNYVGSVANEDGWTT